jgi:hypothetical protein
MIGGPTLRRSVRLAVSSAQLDHQMLHGFFQLPTRMKRDIILYIYAL